MKLALLADLHANLGAVEACLAHAAALGADGHAFLGDLVGYGPEPDEVLDLVAAQAARGAVVVSGNNDAAVVDGRTETMDRAAAAAIAWTRRRLSERGRRFLAGPSLVASRGAAASGRAAHFTPVPGIAIPVPGIAIPVAPRRRWLAVRTP